MGNQISSASFFSSTAAAGIDNYLDELPFISYQKSLSSTRFMKTIKGKFKETGLPVVVKIFIQPDPPVIIDEYREKYSADNDKMTSIIGLLPCLSIHQTPKAVYLLREYISTNVCDKLSSRPFLHLYEKFWICFQFMEAVRNSHNSKLYHGDIKLRNLLLTSWNSLCLTDFASFKPTYLPENNPADFYFYFATTTSKACYIAPERFYIPEKDSILNFKANTGKCYLDSKMDVFSAGCVIAELFLEDTPLFTLSQLLEYKRGEYNPLEILERIGNKKLSKMISHMIQLDPSGRYEMETYLTRFSKLFPGFWTDFYRDITPYLSTSLYKSLESPLSIPDARINLFSSDTVIKWLSKRDQTYDKIDSGNMILLPILTSSLRHAKFPSSRLESLDLLQKLCTYITEDVTLNKIIPYLVVSLSDQHPLIRCKAIKILSDLLLEFKTIPRTNENIIVEYILPHLKQCLLDKEVIVRATLGHYISAFADIGERFLELEQLNNLDDLSYDLFSEELRIQILDILSALLVDPSSAVRCHVQNELPTLCIFLGQPRANDIVLSHSITYLNDNDWALRCSFFQNTVGLATFFGKRILEDIILPLIFQSLSDPCDVVVEKVVSALTGLVELRILDFRSIVEIVKQTSPLLCHPNRWIRYGAASFITATSRVIASTDFFCILYPNFKPFVDFFLPCLSNKNFSESLKKNISRDEFDFFVRNVGMIEIDKQNIQKSKDYDQFSAVVIEASKKFSLSKERVKMIESMMPFFCKFEVSKLLSLTPISAEDEELKRIRVMDQSTQNYFISPPNEKTNGKTCINENERFTITKRKELRMANLLRDITSLYFPPLFPDNILQRHGIRNTTNITRESHSFYSWKPQGKLFGSLIDHDGPVNCLAVSPDYKCFASASDDGTVKVWDLSRLEKNVLNRPKLTHYQGGEIKSITFSKDTRCLISASSNATIHMVWTDFNWNSENILLNEIKLDKEMPLLLDTYRCDGESILIYATSKGNIYGWDLNRQLLSFTLKNEPHYGFITALAVDKAGLFLIVGTQHGVVALWDIRFCLEIKSWKTLHGPICGIQQLGSKEHEFILFDGSGQASLWDLATSTCTEIWCTLPKGLKEESIERLINFNSTPVPCSEDLLSQELSYSIDGVTRCILISEALSYIIVGEGRKIHFWNLNDFGKSFVMNKLEESETEWEFKTVIKGRVVVHVALMVRKGTEKMQKDKRQDYRQRTLDRENHFDHITHFQVSPKPCPLILTSSRDGSIKAWI